MKDVFSLRQEALEKIAQILGELDQQIAGLDPFQLLPRNLAEQEQANIATEALQQVRTSVQFAAKRSASSLSPVYLPITDPKYEPPTRQLLERKFTEYDHKDIATLLGVDTRAIKRWLNGETAIPYTCWRLFLVATGEVAENLGQITKID